MKEITDIIKAFQTAKAAQLSSALATVVQVEGSSYRQPGARMLITEDGQLTGAISGGCLEGDALRKAQLAMAQQQPVLVTYDTNDEDDAKLGLGLGCNGIVHILIEPIDPAKTNHPIALLQKAVEKRLPFVLMTLFSLTDRKACQSGTCMLLQASTMITNAVPNHLQQCMLTDAEQALENNHSLIKEYDGITAFIEVVQPAIQLIIAGAGNDVMPIVRIAEILGWQTIVADGRSNYATAQRFPTAGCTLMVKPEALMQQIQPDNRTAVLLMTHNYNYDLAMLQYLLPLQLPYIGLLGPKQKKQRLLDELESGGMQLTNNLLQSLYGPTGLDIGAETAEEIALSIIAEIQAVFTGKPARMLREKRYPIHTSNV